MRNLIFGTCLCLSFGAWADINGLCQQGVEGSYVGTMGSLNVRINIFCPDPQRLMGTVYPVVTGPGEPIDLDAVANLPNSTIDGTRLIMANFLIGSADRRSGSSKSIVSYIRIDLATLKTGRVLGIFMSGNLPDFLPLDATRTQTFPQMIAVPRLTLNQSAIVGSYTIPTTSFGAANLIFDILAGAPVMYLRPKGDGTSVHLTDGLAWDGSGVVSLVTAEGNGGEADDTKMCHIRGRFITANQMEIYIISPATGIEGPLTISK